MYEKVILVGVHEELSSVNVPIEHLSDMDANQPQKHRGWLTLNCSASNLCHIERNGSASLIPLGTEVPST